VNAASRAVTVIALLAGSSIARGQQPAQESMPRSEGAAAERIDRAALTRLLADLDRAFSLGDAKAYLERFEPDNRKLHDRLAERLRRLLHGNPGWTRHSELRTEPRLVGPRTVVGVRSEARLAEDAPAVVETGLLVLRPVGARLVPTAYLPAPIDGGDCPIPDHFACPACNYAIGGVDGWLGVPLPGATSETVDGVSFHLLGTDVTCDFAVEIDDPLPGEDRSGVGAVGASERLTAALLGLAPAATPPMPEAWRPASLQTAVPPEFSGARQRLVLPDGSIAIVLITALGPLRHALLVRGSARAVDAGAAAIDALLASYRFLDLELDRSTLANAPFAAHTGGQVDGASFRSERHSVRCDGPPGWSVRQRNCGAAFKVNWTCPERIGWLSVCGYLPPLGLARWRERDADSWLADLCARAQLAIDSAADRGWRPSECGGLVRELTLVAAAGHRGGPTPRWLRLWLRDDLLVVADAHGRADDEPLLRAAMASIRPR
jgi:hypothetical protein